MSDPYLIKVVAFSNGMWCPHAGQFVETFDHDACDGVGHGTFTADLDKAMAFETFPEAAEFWRKASTIKPTRPDGKPNRPLTCASVEISRRSTFEAGGSISEMLNG